MEPIYTHRSFMTWLSGTISHPLSLISSSLSQILPTARYNISLQLKKTQDILSFSLYPHFLLSLSLSSSINTSRLQKIFFSHLVRVLTSPPPPPTNSFNMSYTLFKPISSTVLKVTENETENGNQIIRAPVENGAHYLESQGGLRNISCLRVSLFFFLLDRSKMTFFICHQGHNNPIYEYLSIVTISNDLIVIFLLFITLSAQKTRCKFANTKWTHDTTHHLNLHAHTLVINIKTMKTRKQKNGDRGREKRDNERREDNSWQVNLTNNND